MTTPLSYMKDHIQVLQSELDKANARIAQLENATARLLSEAVWQSTTNGWDNRIELDMAKKALQGSSDTWLSEHDKAVEVRVLEEVINRAGESDTVLDLIEERKKSKLTRPRSS